jgi:hypothetical protein
MLQNFLDENLITLTEDAQFNKLTKASTELAKKLVKDKSSIVRFTLAAIDPEIAPDTPEIKEAKEIIAKGWNTFSSVAKDTPVTYLRAIILEAIESVASDIHIAALVGLIAGNIKHYFKSSAIEQKLIGEFIDKLEKRVTSEANLRFASKYGKTSGVGETLPVGTTRAEVETAQLKTDLLWWKFAGYSSSLDNNYKSASKTIASLAMANDYSALLPAIYPKSANYFLKETYQDNFSDENITFTDFFAVVEKEKEELRNFLPQKSIAEGRLSLYNFTNALIWDQLSAAEFQTRVGVDPKKAISNGLLNLWLFQDLHIYKTL